MGLATTLRNSVIKALAQHLTVEELTDEDFAFIVMANEYGRKREEAKKDPRAAPAIPDHVLAATEAAAKEEARAFRPGIDGPTGNGSADLDAISKHLDEGQGALKLDTKDPSAEHDKAQTLNLDRGPEPQEVSEVLDTRQPISGVDEAPDYTQLGQGQAGLRSV